MAEQKLSRTEIVRLSYRIAATMLQATLNGDEAKQECREAHGLSEQETKRVLSQLDKVAKRLSRQAH